MHDIKKQMQFIELRAQGNSYQKISKKIGVSKQTLSTQFRNVPFLAI